ncbi:phage virion morphogenesis protein [Stappia sp.]|uniref:phage virion morphogenesis protein n=1 Tax=Stappia sp. TaxID=1870903 RepID=UPI003A998C4E
MTGIAIRVDDTDLAARLVKIEGLVDAPQDDLRDGIGRLVQEQTRRRIESEKTAPDGTPWKANRAGTSTLYAEGHLSRSVDYVTSGSGVLVGSGLIYARPHQKGATIKPKDARALRFMVGDAAVFARTVTLPQREWLGLSDENRRDIEGAVIDWLGSILP